MAKGFKHGGGGGAALNFTVVGGTEQPARAKENTIWVNTDQKITSWVFSATEPTEPTEGMVWISTGASSLAFNALKKNVIQVRPCGAKMHLNGAWENKKAQIYQNGAWAEWTEWVFRNGEFTKGTWGGFKDGGKTVEFVDGQIHLEVDGSGSATFYTTEKFDTTGRSELIFVVSKITQTSTVYKGKLHFGIGLIRESHDYATEISLDTEATTEPQEFIVTITPEYYGEYYIKASVIRSASFRDGMYISEIRLQ